MTKFSKLSEQLLKGIGGLSNITYITHCATRLRVSYRNKELLKMELLENLPNSSGIIALAGTVQIIIGTDVHDAYNEFLEYTGWTESENSEGIVTESEESQSYEKRDFQYYLLKFSNFIAPIFMPIIPALITGGMILAIKNLLVNYFGVSIDSGTAQWMLNIFDAAFKFLPIYIGYTMAQQLKMQPIMGAMLGAVLISLTFENGLIPDIFGLLVPQVSYRSTILPFILGVDLMYFVDKGLKKVLPKTLSYFLKPLLTMIIVTPVVLILLAPAGNLLSGYVADFVLWVSNTLGIIALPLLSMIYPYMVMFGLDKGLHPIALELLDKLGYNPVTIVIGFISNICIGATTLALAFSMKDKAQKATAVSSGITALCGVTEPAFYGQLISHPKCMIGYAVGALCAGLFAGFFHLKTFVHGGCPGWLTLLFFVDQNGNINYVLIAIVAALIGMIVSFFATCIILRREGKLENNKKFSNEVIN